MAVFSPFFFFFLNPEMGYPPLKEVGEGKGN